MSDISRSDRDKELGKLVDSLPVIAGLSYEKDRRRWRAIVPPELCHDGVPFYFAASGNDPFNSWLTALCAWARVVVCHLRSQEDVCSCRACYNVYRRTADTTRLTPYDFTESCAEGVDATEILPPAYFDGIDADTSFISETTSSCTRCKCLSYHISLAPSCSAAEGYLSVSDQELSCYDTLADDGRSSLPCFISSYSHFDGSREGAAALPSLDTFDNFVSEDTGIFPLETIPADASTKKRRCIEDRVPSSALESSVHGSNAEICAMNDKVTDHDSGKFIPDDSIRSNYRHVLLTTGRQFPHAGTNSGTITGSIDVGQNSQRHQMRSVEGKHNGSATSSEEDDATNSGVGEEQQPRKDTHHKGLVFSFDGDVSMWISRETTMGGDYNGNTGSDYKVQMDRLTTDYTSSVTPRSPELDFPGINITGSNMGSQRLCISHMDAMEINGISSNASSATVPGQISPNGGTNKSRRTPLKHKEKYTSKFNGGVDDTFCVDDDATEDDSCGEDTNRMNAGRRRRHPNMKGGPVETAESLKPWYREVFWVPSISRWRTSFIDESGTRHTKTFTPYVFGGIKEAYNAAVEYKIALDKICGANGISDGQRSLLKRNVEMSLKRKRLGRSPRGPYTSYLRCGVDAPVTGMSSQVSHSNTVAEPNPDVLSKIVEAVQHNSASSGCDIDVLSTPIPRNLYM